MAQSDVNPPSLPPSVEEAYRRKCLQLKKRLIEVEEANAASTLRLQRMHRGIEKMRLERAFLLEQLAKRTSTKVDDSEGSPSPPPTPKEKPLRTKRGHRKPSFLQDLEDGVRMPTVTASGAAQNPGRAGSASPTSEAFSQAALNDSSHTASKDNHPNTTANGNSASNRTGSKNAFEVFAEEQRPIMQEQNQQAISDGTYDLDQELARKWRRINADQEDEHQPRQQGRENSRPYPSDNVDNDVEMADDVDGDRDGL